MSKRLQVIMEEGEYSRIQSVAAGKHLSVGEYVRRELRRSVESADVKPAEQKLRAIQRALQFNFPTADIDQMNAEIEMGYSHGLP